MEAAALSEMAENTKDDPAFRVPTVDWERTARAVLAVGSTVIDATPTPVKLPPPLDSHEVELWGQTREEWRARRARPST